MFRTSLFSSVMIGVALVACGDDADRVAASSDTLSQDFASPEVDATVDVPQTPDVDVSPEPDVAQNPLIGRVYVQSLGVGWASYHFDATDDVYISYANATDWRLDNDTPFPEKKAFIDIMFDIPSRSFYGTIDWSEPEGTTVGRGVRGWVYEMIFSEDYGYIRDGSITSVMADGTTGPIQMFNGDIFYTELEP